MTERSTKPPRKERILNELKDVIRDLGGLDRDQITDQATFLEFGFDSLFLALMSSSFEEKFRVDVTFRQLLEEVPNLDSLAGYIDSRLPPEEPPASTPQAGVTASQPIRAAEPTPQVEVTTSESIPLAEPTPQVWQPVFVTPCLVEGSLADQLPNSGLGFESVISQQLQIMAKQLELLSYRQVPVLAPQATFLSSTDQGNGCGVASSENGVKPDRAAPELVAPSSEDEDPSAVRRAGPWKPIDKSASQTLDSRQRKYLDDLILRYTTRTQKSKELTAAHRPHLADPRAVSGFRTEWKEMVYPIVSARSSGSKLWDLDGNQYVDMLMGFGVALFGHSPDFVLRALEEQIQSGIEIGPQSPLAGEVARLICDFTGMERVTFCNTGSEAALAALRVARTVTGRTKIALFAGSYHGIFDEVLVRPITTREGYRTMPVAPGIPPDMVKNVLLLDYGNPETLNLVQTHADELAAVFVEPVQSRNPDLQPKEFLQGLRELTAKSGIALIFDEVITGFRLHPCGAQGWFGIQADLATYGKALGAGMPVGVLAGKARFMDALDGGAWTYGDSSIPEARVTYFAGTFVRHPLAIAAASAVLGYLKETGSQLYQALNERASRLAKELNQYFERTGAPIHIGQCGSLFYLRLLQENRFSSLFFFYLREKGVHIWEGRPIFISTAHTDEDLAFVAQAIKESAEEMQEAGFFPAAPGRTPIKPKPADSSELNGGAFPAGSHTERSCIPTTPSTGPCEFPLTEAQMEIWLATQLGNDASQAFNENILLGFKGALNLAALRVAIQRIVDRHEALRTTFSPDGGYQRINPPSATDIDLIDLSESEPGSKDARFQELITGALQQPFDLVNGPLIRASVLKLAPEEHFLLFTAHHLVCDGWSIHVLLRDLSALYSRACNFQEKDLLIPTPFREYAVWQQQQQISPEGGANERYWMDRFTSPAVALKLPADRPRREFRTFNGSCHRVHIEKTLHAGMKRFGARHGCTAFVMFLAAFKVLLHRLSAQEDVIVGIVSAGQSMMGIDDVVGHCVNTLPLRDRIDPDQPFADFLKSVNRSFLDAYEHQNYTFGTLVKKLNLRRDPSQTPLISVMFNMDQALEGLRFGDLDFEVHPDPNPYVNFELSFNLFEKQGRLVLECEYNRDLFEASTIARWIGHYENLLRGILSDPNQPIAVLPLLSEAERQQLLIEWNRTEKPYPKDLCIHELFEAQVVRSPDAIAVIFEDQQLTYRELNRRANQLAHCLQKLGVGPEVLVGICVERSLEMVVGLLAILKAGGAYVPLDPSYPRERLAFILEDARAPVLLTQSSLLDSLPEHRGRVECLDSYQESIARDDEKSLAGTPAPNNLAYVIYTSGSTGRPKGVAIEHRCTVSFLHWAKEIFRPEDVLGVLASTSVCFDLSVFEIFFPLSWGSKVILANNILDLRTLPAANQVTLVNAVPSALAELLRTNSVPSSVRTVCLAGEPLTTRLVRQICQQQTIQHVFDLYGPSEDTTYSTFALRTAAGPATIGRPIANTQIYLLDSHLQPVPIGVPGEVHIGGFGLARGYLNRAELTAEKFISNPFSARPSERLYRTGDLARYLPDGNIEFLGRLDHQVKIRGFRIELGEIEAVLRQHSATRDAVVVARDVVAGDPPASLVADKRLVAYIVVNDGPAPTVQELRAFLKQRLPDYMVPSAFVFLDSLPLTSNGKVDRGVLPAPDQSRPELESPFEAPRTPFEELLAEIWAKVLKVEKVGIHDNFFDLAGHSLLATQIIAEVRHTFHVDLPLRALFQNQTVARLALQIAQARANKTIAEDVGIALSDVESLSEEEARELLHESHNKKPQRIRTIRSTGNKLARWMRKQMV